jgi:TolA-binding protein
VVSWLVFAAVLLARPALAADSREERLFGAAKEAFQISNWLRAEIQFGQFVESHPKSDRAPEAILMQARSRLKLDQFERAAELL